MGDGYNQHAYGGINTPRNVKPQRQGGGKKKKGCPLWVLAWAMSLTAVGNAVVESL